MHFRKQCSGIRWSFGSLFSHNSSQLVEVYEVVVRHKMDCLEETEEIAGFYLRKILTKLFNNWLYNFIINKTFS